MTLTREFLQDIRYGWRLLGRHPGFSTVAVAILAIGIGANAAIFSAVNEVFIRTAPAVADPARLVALGRSTDGTAFENFGHQTYLKYRDQAQSFTGLAASRGAPVMLRLGGDTVVIEARLVTGNYFSVLGVPLAAGRALLPDDDRTPGAHPVAVVSDRLWKTRLASDPSLVGRRIRLNDTDFAVVGVAAREFRGLELFESTDVWLPLMMEAEAHASFPQLNSDFFSTLSVIGRLRPGVNLEGAAAELAVLAPQIEPARGPAPQRRVRLTPHIRLPDPGWRSEAISILSVLSAASALVLLIACANLAALQLARSAARRQEIVTRSALGAGRARIVRQLVSEGLALAALGAAAGLVVSYWIAALFSRLIEADADFTIDRTVLLFVGLVAAGATVVSGVAPALHLARSDLASGLRGARAATRRRSWWLRVLVGAQVALSLVLVTGAGLFARTLVKARAVDIGFDTSRLWLVQPDLDLAGYAPERADRFYDEAMARIGALPGVAAVGTASALPRYGNAFGGGRDIELPGRGPDSKGRRANVNFNEVSPGYFDTLGVPVLRGRGFSDRDAAGAPRVGVVNETMARTLWPGVDPIGQTLRLVEFLRLGPPIEVVGVVADARTIVLEERPRPELFLPEPQSHCTNLAILARSASAPAHVTAAIARVVHELDPTLPRLTPERLADDIARGLSDQRMNATLTGLFGAMALLLAGAGLAGVMAFAVSQRVHEIGIRLALGANRAAIWRMVVGEGLAITGVGIGVGLPGSVAAVRLIANRLYGIAPTDFASFAAGVAVLVACALAACWWPARRATHIDPLAALRHE